MTRFVVLFMGRSGSTYLIEALRSHPAVQAEFERLRESRKRGAEAQLAHARRLLEPASAQRARAVGFKTKLNDVVDPHGFAELLEEFDVRVIFQQRRNLVKAAVSWSLSEDLRGVTGKWNLYSEEDRPGPIRIDVDQLRGRLHALERGAEDVRDYVAGLNRPKLSIHYEDLLLRPQETFSEVLTFLGVQLIPLTARTMKNASDDLRDVLVNFDELQAAFAGSKYESMFAEVLVAPPSAAPHVTRSPST